MTPPASVQAFFTSSSATPSIQTPSHASQADSPTRPDGQCVVGSEIVGAITAAQVDEIAEVKKNDLNAASAEAAARIIAGTARSMGIEVKG